MSQPDDTFYIIDFDRTLARTDDLRLLFREVVLEHTPITSEQMLRGEQQYKNSFDVATYVRSELRMVMSTGEIHALLDTVHDLFVEKARQRDLLEPYAETLLNELKEKQLPFGILTTGGHEWQQVKIEAAGLNDIPHLVIATSEKSKLLASWKQAGGTFALPEELSGRAGYLARTIVFLDDKPISFEGIPDGVKGVWVQPIQSAKADDITRLEVPVGVLHAHGLKEARDLIFSN